MSYVGSRPVRAKANHFIHKYVNGLSLLSRVG